MSAREDASPDVRPERRAAAPRGSRAVFVLAAIVPGALLGALLLFLPGFLTALPRYECTIPWGRPAPAVSASALAPQLALADGGKRLRVRAASVADTRSLAARLMLDRAAGGARVEGRREQLRSWLTPLDVAPLPPLAPQAECAALLRARAAVGRALAGEGPTTPGVPVQMSAGLAGADRAVEQAALAFLPDALRLNLAEADREERIWLGTLASNSDTPVFDQWRTRERTRADEFDDAAAVLIADVTPFQRELIEWWLPELSLQLEPATPDAGAAVTASLPPAALPVRPWWPAWLGAALCGALVASLGAWAAARARGVHSAPRLATLAPRHATPTGNEVWLHVVSGVDEQRIALAILELAAHFVARGDRVLVMDGARRLRLHEHLGARARFGMNECLAGEIPLMASLHSVGYEGLYLLAHGDPARGDRWSELGRLLEEARPHFGRVLLALDAAAPHAAGESLRGRVLEGWWAGSAERLPRVALALAERTAISFTNISLSVSPESLLEAWPERVSALADPVSPVPVPPALERVEPPAPRPVSTPIETIVMDCDLQVRQRLRFLIWMRRIQTESQREAAVPASRV